MVFKRHFFPSAIIFYEGFISSLLYLIFILSFKCLDLDKSLIVFLTCLLFWSLVPTIIDRSVSVTILGKLNINKYTSYEELNNDFTKVFINENDAIGKRLNEQIINGNVLKLNNKYILSKKGLSTKKSLFFLTKLFNINDSFSKKR